MLEEMLFDTLSRFSEMMMYLSRISKGNWCEDSENKKQNCTKNIKNVTRIPKLL